MKGTYGGFMIYEEYLNIWLSGLKDEVCFWDNYIRNEGGRYFYKFQKQRSNKRKFELDEDIPVDFYGKEYKFIDVGSGPFSRCGKISDKVYLNSIAVDPLAYAYNALKEKYNVDNGINLENGFVELLDKKYMPNTFDMVHMSNSLDHCFSAVDGIYQLLNICKIGGKVILRHAENEAEKEQYKGLHQWNLSLDNPEKSFIIWRDKYRFDICDIFGEYADFELVRNVREADGYWTYNKVVMTKKRDISIPQNRYYEIMMDIIYQKMIFDIVDILTTKDKKDKSPFELRLDKIKEIYHNSMRCQAIMEQLNIRSISIYGMGVIGKNLEYALANCNIRIDKRIDQKGVESGCLEAVKLEDLEEINSDVLVMSINDESTAKLLAQKYKNKKVYMIDEFISIFE